MAIIKKKMASKPMMKNRKAKDGDTVDKGETKTGNVNVRPGFGKSIKDAVGNFYKADFFNGNDSTKTKAGRIISKVGNTAVKAALTPSLAAGILPYGAMKAGERAVKNKQDLNKIPKKKMGGMMKKAEDGGSLKKPTEDQKGLKALPTKVRNKMGFQKNGGAMKKAMMGSSMMQSPMMKKGGKISKKKQHEKDDEKGRKW